MVNFKKFSRHFANDDIVKISDDMNVPDMYNEAVNNVTAYVKNMVDVFDKVEIPFIQNTLTEHNDLDSELRITQGDIPDGILNTIASKIYKKTFNECNVDEQSIIKTVAIYICIAVNIKTETN